MNVLQLKEILLYYLWFYRKSLFSIPFRPSIKPHFSLSLRINDVLCDMKQIIASCSPLSPLLHYSHLSPLIPSLLHSSADVCTSAKSSSHPVFTPRKNHFFFLSLSGSEDSEIMASDRLHLTPWHTCLRSSMLCLFLFSLMVSISFSFSFSLSSSVSFSLSPSFFVSFSRLFPSLSL